MNIYDLPFLFFLIIFVCGFTIYRIYLHYRLKYPYYHVDIILKYRQHFGNDPIQFIDEYLNKYGIFEFKLHMNYVDDWMEDCENYISNSLFFKNKKRKIYENNLDEYTFIFDYYRYQGDSPFYQFEVKYEFLQKEYAALEKIDFKSTLRQHHIKRERNLMSQKLRDKILKRDNNTCQICGLYMPFGSGAQIDHIIPVSKGGKTTLSNLQVLCANCNREKSDKIIKT